MTMGCGCVDVDCSLKTLQSLISSSSVRSIQPLQNGVTEECNCCSESEAGDSKVDGEFTCMVSILCKIQKLHTALKYNSYTCFYMFTQASTCLHKLLRDM